MSRTRPARRPNSAASSSGRPNSLTSVAPGAEKRSVICDVIAASCTDASRSEMADTSTDPPRRDHEQREQGEGEQRDRPRQAGHHGHREDEGDDVRDDPGQRRRERPLGADDVVVEAADQGAGVGAREEGDRHRLDVLEDPSPQVDDETLAESCRLAAVRAGRRRCRRRRRRRSSAAMPTTTPVGAAVDDGVDRLPGEERRGDTRGRPTPWRGRGRRSSSGDAAWRRRPRGATCPWRRRGGCRCPASRSAAPTTSRSRSRRSRLRVQVNLKSTCAVTQSVTSDPGPPCVVVVAEAADLAVQRPPQQRQSGADVRRRRSRRHRGRSASGAARR